jgi:hypothetical protein
MPDLPNPADLGCRNLTVVDAMPAPSGRNTRNAARLAAAEQVAGRVLVLDFNRASSASSAKGNIVKLAKAKGINLEVRNEITGTGSRLYLKVLPKKAHVDHDRARRAAAESL